MNAVSKIAATPHASTPTVATYVSAGLGTSLMMTSLPVKVSRVISKLKQQKATEAKTSLLK